MSNLRGLLGGIFRGVMGRHHPAFRGSAEIYRTVRDDAPPFFREVASIGSPGRGNLVLFSVGAFYAPLEAALLKTAQALGYRPIVVASKDPWLANIFKSCGIPDVRFLENYLARVDPAVARKQAEEWLKAGTADWRTWQLTGVPCGMLAAASQMRRTREATVALETPQEIRTFQEELERAIVATKAVEKLWMELSPRLLLICDRGYTPAAQLFYTALQNNVNVVTYNGAHRSNYLILKRYADIEQALTHPYAISSRTWAAVKSEPAVGEIWPALRKEIFDCYNTGEWFSEVGTQFNKQLYSKQQLQENLKLDPNKKTAIIFPHMFWDATFCYGRDIFSNYEEWFEEVLKVANKNSKLNWIIKIHPANLVKAKRDGYKGKHKELASLDRTIGDLPPHIKVIPPESDLSTISLFSVMDYCLTVRGTVGMEAAAFGIVTLTAGTGRFDRLGFTRDFDTRAEYLQCIATLSEVPPMSAQQIELARRYAHTILMRRPIKMDCVAVEYQRNANASARIEFHCATDQQSAESQFAQRVSSFLQTESSSEIEPLR